MSSLNMLEALRARGVILIAPATIGLADDLDPDRFARGATIHPGCRVAGRETALGSDCVLGPEGPVTLIDCQLGAGVRFASGFAQKATLLDGVEVGANAHLRPGTLLEEQVSIGHCVGLKQTILLPFVTLGSLINFCDCLMAGGTGSDNHSEVGSGYVHFNFTPRQDKATPSLVGDVPRGVLLDQPPIFLGGQGGLVGPRRIAFGTVLAAGQICRRDIENPGNLIVEPALTARIERPQDPCHFGALSTILENNRRFLGNLLALETWYRRVRLRALKPEAPPWRTALPQGALQRLDEAFGERLKRLEQLAGKMAAALAGHPEARNARRRMVQEACVRGWPGQRKALLAYRERLRKADEPSWPRPAAGTELVSWVQALPPADRHAISRHLQAIVDNTPACNQNPNP